MMELKYIYTAFSQNGYLKLPNSISFNQDVFIRNYSNKKYLLLMTKCLAHYDNIKRNIHADYDYFSPPVIIADLHYFPNSQLIYKWNNLPLLVMSLDF